MEGSRHYAACEQAARHETKALAASKQASHSFSFSAVSSVQHGTHLGVQPPVCAAVSSAGGCPLKEEVVCEFLQERQRRWRQRGALKTRREQ